MHGPTVGRCGFDGLKFWEELHHLRSKETLVEVEPVQAHRTKKGRQHMSSSEKFIAEGTEKADELGKGRSDVGRRIHGAYTSKKGPAGKRRRVWSPCSTQPVFTAWWRNGMTVKNSSRSHKKIGLSWTRKQSMERSGVPCPAGIVA